MGWIARLMLFLGGMIAGIFVSRDANNFPIVSMVSGLFLFMIVLAILAFYPNIVAWIKNLIKKPD